MTHARGHVEAAKQADSRGNDRGKDIRRHDQSHIGIRPIEHEARDHDGRQREIAGDRHVLDRKFKHACLGRGDEAGGEDRNPQQQIQHERAIERDEPQQRQQNRRADQQQVMRRRLGYDDPARRKGEPDIGQAKSLQPWTDLLWARGSDRHVGRNIGGTRRHSARPLPEVSHHLALKAGDASRCASGHGLHVFLELHDDGNRDR